MQFQLAVYLTTPTALLMFKCQ